MRKTAFALLILSSACEERRVAVARDPAEGAPRWETNDDRETDMRRVSSLADPGRGFQCLQGLDAASRVEPRRYNKAELSVCMDRLTANELEKLCRDHPGYSAQLTTWVEEICATPRSSPRQKKHG